MPHSPHDLGGIPPEPGSVQPGTPPEPGSVQPEEPLGSVKTVVEISSYTLSIQYDGNAQVILWSAERPGIEIAKMVFSRHLKEPTANWIDDPGSIVWFTPFSALDAVLTILRDGDPPIRLQVWRSEEAIAASLSTNSKTRVASDNV